MPSRSEYERQREKFGRQQESRMMTRIARMQDRLYSALLDIVTGMALDQAGRIVFNVRNIEQVNRVSSVITAFERQEKPSFLQWTFRKLTQLFGLNSRYFNAFMDQGETIDERVRRRLMLRYGFDVRRNRIIPGGYFDEIASSRQVGVQVARLINEAISARLSLTDFKRDFRSVFVNPQGLGLLERHYDRFSFDLFQQFDRETQLAYAEELNLDHFIYSGTIKDNTRPFCEARTNNIFSVEFAQEWEGQDWKGKIPGVSFFVQCGGYRCRHHLSYISEELAQKLNRPVNELNAV